MRHGSSRITVDIYSQARNPEKRAAQQRLVQMILPEEKIRPVVASSMSSTLFRWCRGAIGHRAANDVECFGPGGVVYVST